MNSFIDLDRTLAGQPPELGVILSRIDTGRGREQLFEVQAPEVLRELAESARVSSITASNAIEGVFVESGRALKIAEGAPRFRNRNEMEFAGYRDAIDSLLRMSRYEPLTVPFVLHLHRQLFQHSGARGGYLKVDANFIVSYENGRREVLFSPPPPSQTEFLLRELVERYNMAKNSQKGHPLVLIGALILDLLAIHPVADGNGRLSRLLTTYELLSEGYKVARYVSLEQRIYESKKTYYQALFESQQGWHTGDHTIWPWVSYLASVLFSAYEDFERQVAGSPTEARNKQDRVRRYILEQAPHRFRRRDIERALPGISSATIRLALNELRDSGKIKVEGSGQGARWSKVEH